MILYRSASENNQKVGIISDLSLYANATDS